jgi:hypothetical protein
MKKLTMAVLLAAAAACAQAAAPVAKIQSMLAKPDVLCGRFDQTKHLAGMKKPLLSNGRFCVVKGKGVLWSTLKPFPNSLRLTRDEIVHLQGERVAMRMDAKTEPVVRMINSVLFSLLGGELAQLEKLFEVDGSAGKDGWQVALKAREPALAKAIGAIILEGDTHVRRIEMNEAGGDRTSIVFTAMQAGEAAMTAQEAAQFQ